MSGGILRRKASCDSRIRDSRPLATAFVDDELDSREFNAAIAAHPFERPSQRRRFASVSGAGTHSWAPDA